MFTTDAAGVADTAAVRAAAAGMTTDRAEVRRAARRAGNRSDILDAAERVFAAHGVQAGSVRKIGAESGFSAAAIYLFFDNKQHLLVETLARRGDEVVTAIDAAAASGADALDSLHRIIDATVDYFEAHPDFGRLVDRLRALDEFGASGSPLFERATSVITDLVRSGQSAGTIRPGSPPALTHLYEVIVHEHVVLAAAEGPRTANLTGPELHEFIDGALRSTANVEPSTKFSA